VIINTPGPFVKTFLSSPAPDQSFFRTVKTGTGDFLTIFSALLPKRR
jgi:hypothetical protein